MPPNHPHDPAQPSLLARALQALQSPRAPLLLVAISLALSARSLGAGLQTDDHIASYNSRFGAHPWSLFSAAPDEIAEARHVGAFAWWTSPQLRIQLLRPVASLTHNLDFRLWPDAAWAMHLENGLLYALIVLVAARLYRQLLPGSSLAALATLMFTIDEGHAPAVGWIMSRNTLLATLFAMLAVLAHVRAREERRTLFHGLSALCVALALLSAESGVAAFAYLLAYAWVFEAGRWSSRLRSLAPQLSVFVIWAAVYAAMGCGIYGSSWYRELSDPLVVLREGMLDLPLWLVSLVGPSLVGASALAPPGPARLVALLVLLPLLVGLVFALPHSKQNRFFMLGALLCLPPLFTTLPQDRLLIAASFGAFGLLASFLEAARASASRTMRGFRHGMAALHLGLAPLLFVSTINTNEGFERGVRAIVATVDALPKAPQRHVIIVNTPVELLTMYSMIILRSPPAAHLPESLHQLYSGASGLVAERIDANTLQLTAARGWGRIPFERIFCAAHYMPRPGAGIDLPTMQVSVLEANEHGMPYRVQFRFPNQLEAPERAWYTWQGGGPRPWHPPALGQRITLPALDPLQAL